MAQLVFNSVGDYLARLEDGVHAGKQVVLEDWDSLPTRYEGRLGPLRWWVLDVPGVPASELPDPQQTPLLRLNIDSLPRAARKIMKDLGRAQTTARKARKAIKVRR